MRQRVFDPLRLDVAAFAADAGELQGQWGGADLPRLAGSVLAAEPVDWQAEGESRTRRGAEPDTWLHLQAETTVTLQCQRCLQPFDVPIEAERSFRFVRDEAAAESEDVDSDEDVLALTRTLDLRTLVEDELILALPLVPRHETCPQPLLEAAAEEEPEDERPNPFAKLAALKRPPTQ